MEGETTSPPKKMTCDSNGVFMPEDLVFRILLQLPVKPLLRLKSVCKTWCHLIENSAFIDHHLHHHHHPNHLVLAVDSSRTWALTGDKFDAPPLKLDCCFHEIDGKILDIAICNGIVCLHIRNYHPSREYTVSLWNPATKKLKTLEKSPFFPSHVSSFRTHIGFGFDTQTNTYKVVRIFKYQVEVCSANTDSWRIVDSVLPCDTIISNPKVPYRNGTYCWIGRTFGHDSKKITKVIDTFIVSFDFSNEVAETMSLPDVDSVKSDAFLTLAIARDKIVYINRAGRNLEIWMLNEYGVQDSWTNLYTIRRDSIHRILGLSENANFLFMVNGTDLRCCSYNLLTQEQNNLPEGEPYVFPWPYVAQYKESLVQVDRGNR